MPFRNIFFIKLEHMKKSVKLYFLELNEISQIFIWHFVPNQVLTFRIQLKNCVCDTDFSKIISWCCTDKKNGVVRTAEKLCLLNQSLEHFLCKMVFDLALKLKLKASKICELFSVKPLFLNYGHFYVLCQNKAQFFLQPKYFFWKKK